MTYILEGRVEGNEIFRELERGSSIVKESIVSRIVLTSKNVEGHFLLRGKYNLGSKVHLEVSIQEEIG